MSPFVHNVELIACAERYEEHRIHTYELLEEHALRALKVRVQTTPITQKALNVVKELWTGKRLAAWDWEDDVLRVLRRSHPRRLEMAFWVNEELCGLATARMSDAKEWVSITHMEGAPFPEHSLSRRVAALSIKGADIFSIIAHDESSSTSRARVRIMNPLENAITCYAHNGYSELHQQNGYSFLVPAA